MFMRFMSSFVRGQVLGTLTSLLEVLDIAFQVPMARNQLVVLFAPWALWAAMYLFSPVRRPLCNCPIGDLTPCSCEGNMGNHNQTTNPHHENCVLRVPSWWLVQRETERKPDLLMVSLFRDNKRSFGAAARTEACHADSESLALGFSAEFESRARCTTARGDATCVSTLVRNDQSELP